MPETRALIEGRVRLALDLPLELPEVEFKRDLPFDQLQVKLAKTAMGMANRRDGGLIIIGVSQDSAKRFVLDGMTQSNIDTYVQETVYEFILKYASPPVEVRVVEVEHDSNRYVAIAVSPFARTPVVAKKEAPPNAKGDIIFHKGDFIVRLDDPVRTTRVLSADMMQDLLQLAAGRRAAEIILALREGGVEFSSAAGTAAITQDPQTVSAVGHVVLPNNFNAEIEDIHDLL